MAATTIVLLHGKAANRTDGSDAPTISPDIAQDEEKERAMADRCCIGKAFLRVL